MAAPSENLTREEARRRAALVSSPTYAVHLDLEQGPDTFGVDASLTFEAERGGTDTFVDLTAESVQAATLNGEPLPADARGPTRLRLEQVPQGRNELRVTATMAYQHQGRGLHRFRDPTDDRVYLHSQFEPFDAHLVYPCFDQPDLKGTFELTVDAPGDWVVVSNTAPIERPPEGGAGRWRFPPTPRISPYLTAVVAGPYDSVHDRHGDTDLGIYVRRSLAEHLDADEILEITRGGLDWFAEAFDLDYPFGKYDQLFVPEFSAGAMENPGCVTFTESYVFRSKVTEAARESRAETILHEMAHMWFGDLVTMRWWDDLWLNESFATFMAVLAKIEATRFTSGWVTFLDNLKSWAKYQDQLPTTHPVAGEMPDVESVHQNFDGITYAKGASVLRQLVAWVGQDAFLEGCRRYFRKHAWANAELSDFLGALEDVSGRNLRAWSREWLETTGVNTLAVEQTGDGDTLGEVAVIQSAPDEHPTLRRHRLAVGAYALRGGEGLARVDRAELDIEGSRTVVDGLAGSPPAPLLLVNDDDLTYAKIRLNPPAVELVTQHLGTLDPLPRALIWSAAWDMVRDGDMPARRLASLVMANVAAEDEIGVLQRLLRRAAAAALRYGDPDNRDALLATMADHAREQLDAAPAGSDLQLAWVRHWASCARREDQVADVRNLLEGRLAPEGLQLDVDLRWHLVTCLARVGAVGPRRIDEELERDPTDLGERHAATARAARPDREAKQAALDRLLEDDDLTHTMSRQLWAGIQQLDQPEVLEGFDDRYLAALDPVWDDRSLDWAIEFTEGMFPHPLASPELEAKVDEHLDRDDLEAPRRRALLEQRDTLRRTLRARRVDATAGAHA